MSALLQGRERGNTRRGRARTHTIAPALHDRWRATVASGGGWQRSTPVHTVASRCARTSWSIAAGPTRFIYTCFPGESNLFSSPDFCLLSCRWQVTQQLGDIHSQMSDSSDAERRSDQCAVHGERLTTFCETCTTCICHKCALWGSDHRCHTFRDLDQVFSFFF